MTGPRPYARELGDFLRARRGRLRPHDVGLEPGSRRKVTGLRREELALLAGLSTDYYQRIEQGREVHPSDDVLDALAGALSLDHEERRHLFTLAHAARRPTPARVHRDPERVPEGTRRLLRVMDTPAVILGRHLDLLDWNPMAQALLGDPDAYPADRLNMLLLLFDDTLTGERSCPDWERQALDYIGMMRTAVATDPSHPRATAIVGELSIRSAEFRRLWAQHDVRESVSGSKTFRIPEVGDIVLDWDTYPLPGNPGPVMLVFTAEPGSADADRLHLLASLYATRSAPTDTHPCGTDRHAAGPTLNATA
ncbi:MULTISPECIES: helix-turn-helix transcriptional regulator [unclassified Micromonospora]|uniref:helix-turn-helix transcriptional regulator n=1 Tax=unclassified Micromonospora TaxID=2617518 RepID=UPI0022B65592|nr:MULTISPECIES: helix-turn-helix transcriptional regulator [unclassified Micromonospora]MCZ7423533.1 helix-turn-helix transcriptional regulator [Verrucosispora sp. WMMA2121]WBB91228.1 helix-turn-helix transcriptional regulator [Verrucosispora sp. WMMC514]